MNLSDVVDEAVRHLIAEGKHPPTLLIAFEGGQPVRRTLRFFPATAQQREDVLFLQGRLAGQQYGAAKLEHIWFICEGWASFLDRSSSHQVPSRDPKRLEVLFVVELDATTEELKQREEIQQMCRNQGRVTALQAIPELSSEQEMISSHSLLVLSFLAGFASTSAPADSQHVHRHLLRERLRMHLP